ncbi:hypothetical protein TNIN_280971 [Trichonephila inaurata madagascariensis]|uniref:Uncharacterized protein n=1 Tax=Trichonephila inaurata madagascariensis TaxID=2747483 RepID=A0A8X7CGY3_9ARAC|nr:hypothetical protein TNIN_280971 [Trichonephila inaurata madagascariensis]
MWNLSVKLSFPPNSHKNSFTADHLPLGSGKSEEQKSFFFSFCLSLLIHIFQSRTLLPRTCVLCMVSSSNRLFISSGRRISRRAPPNGTFGFRRAVIGKELV